MQIRINGSNPFKVLKDTFSVAKTSGGYTLQWCNFNSENDEDWTSWPDSVPANEGLIANGCTPYVYFRLSGNTDQDVLIIL